MGPFFQDADLRNCTPYIAIIHMSQMKSWNQTLGQDDSLFPNMVISSAMGNSMEKSPKTTGSCTCDVTGGRVEAVSAFLEMREKN